MTKTASPATDRTALLEALAKGLVEFDYLKADGEFRTVRGTTNYGTIEINGGEQEEAYYAKAFEDNDNDDAEFVLYFDADRKGIRNIRPDAIVPREVYFQQVSFGREV